MSIFTETEPNDKIALYIVPDTMCESAEIEKLKEKQSDLSLDIVADENEKIYHIEIREK